MTHTFKILILIFLIVSNVCHAQMKEYFRDAKNELVLKKIRTLESQLDNEEQIKYIISILDTLDVNNIDLRLALYAKNSNNNFKTSNYEGYYRYLKTYDALALKSKELSYIVNSKLMNAELYFRFGDLDKMIKKLSEVNSLLTNELSIENPLLLANYYNFRMLYYKSINNDELAKIESDFFLKQINKIDTTNFLYHSSYSTSLINYADFIDSKNQNESYKYYIKANAFSVKNKLINNANFAKLRIAGCLINKDEVSRALDTLKIVAKNNGNPNVSYLNYHLHMLAFERINMPDSVAIYKLLFEEVEKVITADINKVRNKLSLEDAVKKVDLEYEYEEKKDNVIKIILLIVIIIGMLIAVVIFKNLYNKDLKI